MMMAQQWPTRKRERDDEDEFGTSSFSAHRTKRHIASLPHRNSPNNKRQNAPIFELHHPTPAPPTITPADSDSEEATWANINITNDYNDQHHSQLGSSQSTQMSEGPTYSDDFDMTDSSFHLSPGPSQPDPITSTTLASRIPTPIHSSFAYLPPKPLNAISEEALLSRFRHGRRLPSPISEGEMSPSVIVHGMNDMQMEVEVSGVPSPEEMETEKSHSPPMKKGHTRSKHSLRNWNGYVGEAGTKKSFSMGYRADCEKCRNKVPGHFSHIITY